MFFFAPYSLDLLLFPVCVDVHHSLPSIVIALVFFVFLLLPLPCLFLPLHRKESKRSHCGIALVITLPSFRIGCFFHSVSSNLKGMNLKFFRKADENGRRKHGNKSIYIYIMSRLNTQNCRHRHESSVVRGQIWVIRNDKALQLKSWSAWIRWCIAEWCWMPAEGRNIMVGFDIVLISASFAIDSPSHQSHPSRLIPDKGFRYDYLLLCHRAGAQAGGAERCSTFVWQLPSSRGSHVPDMV